MGLCLDREVEFALAPFGLRLRLRLRLRLLLLLLPRMDTAERLALSSARRYNSYSYLPVSSIK